LPCGILPAMKKILFVCSQNRLRSPTAEQVFSTWPNIDVLSAGTNHDAEEPISVELIEWADIIVVMEKAHRNKVNKKFRKNLNGKRVLVLDIPDDFDYMQPELVRILEVKVPRLLGLWL
jgi:predicted protein tyrosine phosphatase